MIQKKTKQNKKHLKDVLLGEVKEPTHQYHHHHYPFGGGSQILYMLSICFMPEWHT